MFIIGFYAVVFFVLVMAAAWGWESWMHPTGH
jgi:hypothetical protein